MIKISSLLKFVLVLLAFSCVKKEFTTIEMNNVDEEIVFPLANSELGIDKLLIKDPLDKNINTYVKDNLYHLVYAQNRHELVRDYYKLPDTRNDFHKTLSEIGNEDPALSAINTSPFILPTTDITYKSTPSEDKFILDMASNNIQDAELKKINLFGGELELNASRAFSNNNNTIVINYEMPGVKNSQNQILKGELTIPAGDNTANKKIDLAGYTLNFNQNSSPNELSIFYTVNINATSGNRLVKTDFVDVNLFMHRLDYNTVEGQIGKFIIDSKTDTTKINAFDNVKDVDLKIKNPMTIVTTKNTTGVKSEVIIEDIHYNRLETSKKLDLKNNVFDVPYLTSITTTTPSEKVYIIDNKETVPEGEMTEAISFGPDKFVATASVLIRGDEDPNFFLRRDSYTDIEIKIDLPMEINLSRYYVADTIANDLKDLKDLVTEDTYTDSAAMRITSINTFPADLLLDIIFTKGPNFEVVHSVLGSELLKSPSINNLGDTEGHTVQEVKIGFSKEAFKRIVLEADNIILIGHLRTPLINQNLGYVNIRPNNRLRLGIDFYLKTNIKL